MIPAISDNKRPMTSTFPALEEDREKQRQNFESNQAQQAPEVVELPNLALDCSEDLFLYSRHFRRVPGPRGPGPLEKVWMTWKMEPASRT